MLANQKKHEREAAKLLRKWQAEQRAAEMAKRAAEMAKRAAEQAAEMNYQAEVFTEGVRGMSAEAAEAAAVLEHMNRDDADKSTY